MNGEGQQEGFFLLAVFKDVAHSFVEDEKENWWVRERLAVALPKNATWQLGLLSIPILNTLLHAARIYVLEVG